MYKLYIVINMERKYKEYVYRELKKWWQGRDEIKLLDINGDNFIISQRRFNLIVLKCLRKWNF